MIAFFLDENEQWIPRSQGQERCKLQNRSNVTEYTTVQAQARNGSCVLVEIHRFSRHAIDIHAIIGLFIRPCCPWYRQSWQIRRTRKYGPYQTIWGKNWPPPCSGNLTRSIRKYCHLKPQKWLEWRWCGHATLKVAEANLLRTVPQSVLRPCKRKVNRGHKLMGDSL